MKIVNVIDCVDVEEIFLVANVDDQNECHHRRHHHQQQIRNLEIPHA
jgi:hypothetical protein